MPAAHRSFVASCLFNSSFPNLMCRLRSLHESATKKIAPLTMEKTHMHGAKESRNLMHGMKPSNAHSRVRKISLFLHGWRRYVCRKAQVTLIELNRDTKEIRARHQRKAQHQTKQKQPTQNTNNKTAGFVSRKGCASRSKSRVKKGETGL